MARIRTIKPEFWTDEKIVQLPYEARLLFIGIWNFCDDYGYLNYEPERIRMQILPSDPIDSEVLIDLLVCVGLVEKLYTPDERYLLYIPHFIDHQKVDHPTKSKIAREGSRKLAIPSAVRRGLAQKYGCQPGERINTQCYYCGSPGEIVWWNTTKGRPGSWVSFSHEIDHLEPEHNGGEASTENLVLACRECNRSKGTKDFMEFLVSSREDSRGLAPEGKGREGKGKEDINNNSNTLTTNEIEFSNVFREREERLKELYPHADFEAQKELCLTHYAKQPVVIDPYLVIQKWFNRIPKSLSDNVTRGRPSGGFQTFETQKLNNMKQAARDFVESL